MKKALEAAVAKVKTLPEERQTYAAEILEQIAAAGAEPHRLPDDHRAAVLEGLEQADRGELATEEDMDALWSKCGL